MGAMRLMQLALAGLVFASPAAASAELETTDEIRACIRRNIPDVTSLQAVEFSSRDRVGETRTTRVNIASRRTPAGHRRLLAQVTAPEEVKNTSFLISEGESGISMSVYSPNFEAPKTITGGEASGRLFGTDFSYEDFERLQGFNWDGEGLWLTRLEDSRTEDRPAYVLEARPERSAYSRILSFVDKQTCVALRTEFYESGTQLRKVLIADPQEIRRLDEAWFPHDLMMMDLRDQTQTHLVVQSVNTGLELPAFDDPMQPLPLPKLEVELPKPNFEELDVGTELR